MQTVQAQILQGEVQGILGPYNNHWGILSILNGRETQKVTGILPDNISVGDFCEFVGDWTEHEKYGKQYKADLIIVKTPKSRLGVLKYLRRHFPGVGEKTAVYLFDKFGCDLFDVIEQKHERLCEVKGITVSKAEKIKEQYLKIKNEKKQDVFFETHGITPVVMAKLMDHYGGNSDTKERKKNVLKILETNPYKLIDDINGIGWKKADHIAMSIGISLDSPFRVKAGIYHTLKEAAKEGHCYLSEKELIVKAIQILCVSQDAVKKGVASCIEKGKIIKDFENEFYYIDELYIAEQSTADKLNNLLSTPNLFTICTLTDADMADLDKDQQKAVRFSSEHKVLIITGGPGVGKTRTIRKIIQSIDKRAIVLAAPTGKAAKRMKQATGHDALTIHRLLGYHPFEGFRRNKDNPIDEDVIIIDETSMVDINLMSALMDAVDEKSQIIFVGDVDQLPSVGPGYVLADMIKSGKIPTMRLTEIHRQSAGSLINVNAEKINTGDNDLEFEPINGIQSFWMIKEEYQQKIPDLIIRAAKSIPKKVKRENGETFTPDDIQILCPQKKGVIGSITLNTRLRDEVFNPKGSKISGIQFREKDRVIQLKNNYKLEVFNGDIGHVAGDTISKDGCRKIIVNFEGYDNNIFPVEYPLHELDSLQLAYALTIHKSQGSEYPVVIIPLHTTNYIMLKRQLIYTAITRGKEMVVLIGTQKALDIAVKTFDDVKRNTMLSERIKRG